MDIYNIIQLALGKAIDNYYQKMPVFSDGEEPEKYAVFTVHSKPVNFASGKSSAISYWIDVSVFSPTPDIQLYDNITEAFDEIGAVLSDSRDVGLEGIYPYKKHYSMVFILNIDKNNN